MNRTNPVSVCLMALFLSALGGFNSVTIQAADNHDWRASAEPRLKAVYEQGDFRGRNIEAQWLPDSSGYWIREQDPESGKSDRVFYSLKSGVPVKETLASTETAEKNRLLSPDGQQVLEYRDRNLFVRNLASNQRTQLTEYPADREMHADDPKWSPDGKRVLFVERDITDVRMRSVLVPSDPSYPGVEEHRFARVGEKIHKLRIGVVDFEDQEIHWMPINTPEEGFYLGQVEWAGNSNEVLVEQMSRFRDQRDFLLVNVDSREVKTIFHEKNEAWAVSSPAKNMGLIWLQDGKSCLVISEKDGWRHAYHYSREGEELSLLTPGEYDIIDRGIVDEQGGWFYFLASPENGTQQYLYRVPLDRTGTLQRISPDDQPGTHEYQFSPDAKWAFHTYSRLDVPPVISLISLPEHKRIKLLEDNQDLREKLNSLGLPPTEFLSLEIGEDVTVDAWLMKPKDFDENRKYPMLVYVYGEPHLQTVIDRWGAAQSHFHRVVAEAGYLVVSIDNRGTPAPKGAAWRRAIFGSLGPLSTEEQAAALQELGRVKPYVDLSRVAIWGWSGGGSNTLNAMFRKPDLYKVGIAVVPKPQPHLYNAWFQEIYMRTREVNAEGYERSAPINFAEGLKGDLLIITGSGETNTHIQIIEGLVDRLVEMGKTFDYMVYPNRDHGLREGKGSEFHVRMLILRYLIEHLPREPR